MSIQIDRLRELEIEMQDIKLQRKEEKKAAKTQSTWVNAKKRLPDADTRVLAWADGQVERCWYQDGNWYTYDGTFFLTEKDKLDGVSHWMPRDWMYSREWPNTDPDQESSTLHLEHGCVRRSRYGLRS